MSDIDNQWLWIGLVMRGVHRYASGAAVIATIFHALRTLFQDRFRGARWLAWVGGMLLVGALWFEGLTGYWLVWDERAQLVLETVIRALNIFPSIGVPFTLNFVSNEATDQTWVFFLVLLFAHIALFTVIGLFYWFSHRALESRVVSAAQVLHDRRRHLDARRRVIQARHQRAASRSQQTPGFAHV